MQATNESGQPLVEMELVLVLVALLAVAIVKYVGAQTADTLGNVDKQVTSQGISSARPIAASP